MLAGKLFRWPIVLPLLFIVLLTSVLAVRLDVSKPKGKNSAKPAVPTPTFVSSSLYDLKITDHRVTSRGDTNGGGALHLLHDGQILLADGDGELFLLSVESEKIETTALQARIPINSSQYRNEADKPSKWFRVTDIFVTDQSETHFTVFASHLYWHSTKRCYTLRLSSARLPRKASEQQSVEWRTVFDSSPCFEKRQLPNSTGGRIAKLEDGTLLLTVGTLGHNTLNSAEDADFSYGKILAISLPGGQVRPFSTGNRNPQGLHVDELGVWETEHGPRGGDELNLIVEGENYGYPKSSYGTKYKDRSWDHSVPGTHKVGKLPIYAWVPSIGVSSLIRMSSESYPLWRGDLLIGSLSGQGNGKSLFRVRVREGRAILVERIPTKQLVRDLIQTQDGQIVLWNGRGMVQLVEPGDYVFSSCLGCHAVRYRNHGIGPDLARIFGAKVARHKGYTYSDALKSVSGNWTRDRLDAFLEDPQKFAPGTTMEFGGIADPNERRTIILYLEQVGKR